MRHGRRRRDVTPEARIPLVAADRAPAPSPGMALVLTGGGAAPEGFALLRHAEGAAAAQAGACPCCRQVSSLAAVLRQLFLDAVHGRAAFAAVCVVAAGDAVAAALADPLVAARFELQGRSASPC
jgi:hypothetical protein